MNIEINSVNHHIKYKNTFNLILKIPYDSHLLAVSKRFISA